MTRDGLRHVLLDLGWLALTHQALGGKPSATFALYQLMQAAGRPVPYEVLAEGYSTGAGSLPNIRRSGRLSGSREGIAKRIERAREALADMGCVGVISSCDGAYLIQKRDLPRIEAAILFACGIELSDEVAA